MEREFEFLEKLVELLAEYKVSLRTDRNSSISVIFSSEDREIDLQKFYLDSQDMEARLKELRLKILIEKLQSNPEKVKKLLEEY